MAMFKIMIVILHGRTDLPHLLLEIECQSLLTLVELQIIRKRRIEERRLHAHHGFTLVLVCGYNVCFFLCSGPRILGGLVLSVDVNAALMIPLRQLGLLNNTAIPIDNEHLARRRANRLSLHVVLEAFPAV